VKISAFKNNIICAKTHQGTMVYRILYLEDCIQSVQGNKFLEGAMGKFYKMTQMQIDETQRNLFEI
jgi:hypothetical protein